MTVKNFFMLYSLQPEILWSKPPLPLISGFTTDMFSLPIDLAVLERRLI